MHAEPLIMTGVKVKNHVSDDDEITRAPPRSCSEIHEGAVHASSTTSPDCPTVSVDDPENISELPKAENILFSPPHACGLVYDCFI